MIPLLAAALFATSPPSLRAATIEDKLVETFRPLVGHREQPLGSNRSPLIDAWNRSAGVPLGSPWCASVAHWHYRQLGLPARGAWSPSWYDKARVIPRSQVRPGDIALVWKRDMNRYAHVIACVERVSGRDVVCLEGNTNAQGSREGHGFFRRVRRIDSLTFVRWR